jgi:hypothetical protein
MRFLPTPSPEESFCEACFAHYHGTWYRQKWMSGCVLAAAPQMQAWMMQASIPARCSAHPA